MKSKLRLYDVAESAARIDEILTTSDNNFEEVDTIPSRDSLTFNNGYYVNCSCVFIDIRGSSELPQKYRRPTLARIYRSFISECVAVLNSFSQCIELNIHGDAVWGVFDTPKTRDIDATFMAAYTLASLTDVLNCRFEKKTNGIDPIVVGIGASYGRALMIKAGAKNSGVNDVVWMGDVVNEASKLCGAANAHWMNGRIMVSTIFYNNLNDHNKGLLQYNATQQCYHGNVISVSMQEWLEENRQ